MNKKKTNLVVTILNIFFVICLYIDKYLVKNIYDSFIFSKFDEKWMSTYDLHIIEFFLNNLPLIEMIVCSIIGVLNIICAIQNKSNTN